MRRIPIKVKKLLSIYGHISTYTYKVRGYLKIIREIKS
jgi:hypothetical protein